MYFQLQPIQYVTPLKWKYGSKKNKNVSSGCPSIRTQLNISAQMQKQTSLAQVSVVHGLTNENLGS